MDNQRLEQDVDKWKVDAEEFKSSMSKYCREMSKIFSALEEAKSELPCMHIEHSTQQIWYHDKIWPRKSYGYLS